MDFFLPISLLYGIVAGSICQCIIPILTLSLTHGKPISQFLVYVATIIIPFIFLGAVSGAITGRTCPAKNPHVGSISLIVFLLICFCFYIFRSWNSYSLSDCIISIIGCILALISSYFMAYSIKKEN